MISPTQQNALPDRLRMSAPVLSLLCLLILVAAHSAVAQTFTVIHQFTGGADGANPQDGLVMDGAGNLYGVTEFGGNVSSCVSGSQASGCGVVFKMKHSGSSWTLSPLHTFAQNGTDGSYPVGHVVFGPDGALYGTTSGGGTNFNGAVFRLAPSATACKSALCPWTENVLYSFTYATGNQPYDVGGLAFDSTGNLYGTTTLGGNGDRGVVFEVSPAQGGWTEQTLYSFANSETTYGAYGGVVLDPQGNLYGNLEGGCDPDCTGTIFQLYNSGSGWTQNIIYAFTGNDGDFPYAGLIRDAEGNLYGSCTGTNYGGVPAFELSPAGGGFFNYSVLTYITDGLGIGPEGNLVMDSAGNIYGTNFAGGPNFIGNVFKLTPSASGWTYTDLYDFNGQTDGGYPKSNVVLDAQGNLYGTASGCGRYECSLGNYGVVWEITP